MEIEIDMMLVKSTKNTHVYNNDSPKASIPTLYVKKEALPAPPPGAITVTVKFSDER